jgi:hypothetical protein
MKELLAFLILLMVGMALFALPIVNDTVSANTVESAQLGVFATVTDVSPVIVVQAENFSGYINHLQITAINDENKIKDSLYRREAYPLSRYSKAAIKDSGGRLTSVCFVYK